MCGRSVIPFLSLGFATDEADLQIIVDSGLAPLAKLGRLYSTYHERIKGIISSLFEIGEQWTVFYV